MTTLTWQSENNCWLLIRLKKQKQRKTHMHQVTLLLISASSWTPSLVILGMRSPLGEAYRNYLPQVLPTNCRKYGSCTCLLAPKRPGGGWMDGAIIRRITVRAKWLCPEEWIYFIAVLCIGPRVVEVPEREEK